MTSRRHLIQALVSAPLVAASGEAGATPETSRLWADLERYAAAGDKASGGPGDAQVAAWLETEAKRLGYEVETRAFDCPGFVADEVSLTMGQNRAVLLPQAPWSVTPPQGVTAPISVCTTWAPPSSSEAGRIVLLVLPHGRWSSLKQPAVAAPLKAAAASGAAAVIIVPMGPSGEAVAFNVEADLDLGGMPMAVLAPKDAAPFLAAGGQTATLTLTGQPALRRASNLTARRNRGAGRWLVVSTPRSGWFGCVAERGPGVAVWLDLLCHLAVPPPGVNLAFVSSSGHEYEYLGMSHLLGGGLPAPEETALWLHLGAGFAARDWHEAGARLLPLPSADPQRYLVATNNVRDIAAAAFAGQPGLEQVYTPEAGSAGELAGILKAGYPRAAGLFGAHRLHHARADTLDCVSLAPVVAAAEAARTFVRNSLKTL